MIKSGYQRGREDALRRFSNFLADTAARSRKAAFAKGTPVDSSGSFDRGVLVGIAVAHERLLEIVESGQIPRLENILPAETQV